MEDRRDNVSNERASTASCIGDNPGGQPFQELLLTMQRRGGGECGGSRTTWWHAPTCALSAALEEGKLTEKQLGLGAPSRGRERRVKASQHGRVRSCRHRKY